MAEKLPMQPVYVDAESVIRFRENKLVRHLLDNGGLTMNDLAVIDFPREDREQFAQLIGYSLGGYGELSYVRDRTYDRADRKAEKLRERLARKAADEAALPAGPARRNA